LVRAGHGYLPTDFQVDVDAWPATGVPGTYGLYFGSTSTGFYDLEIDSGISAYGLRTYNYALGYLSGAINAPSQTILPNAAPNHLTIVGGERTTSSSVSGK